ncbi:Uncharacterised protein [Vibrio cholerae]|nr:Uncharacterised protein [Vibrio cholerae]
MQFGERRFRRHVIATDHARISQCTTCGVAAHIDFARKTLGQVHHNHPTFRGRFELS